MILDSKQQKDLLIRMFEATTFQGKDLETVLSLRVALGKAEIKSELDLKEMPHE